MGAYLLWLDDSGVTNTLKFDVVTQETWSAENKVTEHPVERGADVADNVRVGLSKVSLTVFATNEPFQANSFVTPAPQTRTLTIASPNQPPNNPAQVLVAKEWDNGLTLRTVLQGIGAAAGGLAGDIVGGVVGALANPPHEVDTPFTPGVGLNPTTGGSFSVSLITIDDTQDLVSRMYDALEALRLSAQVISVIGTKCAKADMVISSVSMDRDSDAGTGAEFTVELQEIRFVSTQTVDAPQPTIPSGKTPVNKGPQTTTPATPAQQKSWLKQIATLIQATPKGG